jgi:hypothetical protein
MPERLADVNARWRAEDGGESMRREVKAGEDSSLRSGILHFVQNDSFASE